MKFVVIRYIIPDLKVGIIVKPGSNLGKFTTKLFFEFTAYCVPTLNHCSINSSTVNGTVPIPNLEARRTICGGST